MSTKRTDAPAGKEFDLTIFNAASGLCLALAACTPALPDTGHPPPISPVAEAIIVDTPGSPTIDVLTGDPVYELSADESETLDLHGLIDRKTGTQEVRVEWGQVYLADKWRLYSSASSERGTPYRIAAVERSLGSCHSSRCLHSERYNIYIPAEDMRLAGNGGLRLNVFGQDGTACEVMLPSATITAFNRKMSEAASRVRK